MIPANTYIKMNLVKDSEYRQNSNFQTLTNKYFHDLQNKHWHLKFDLRKNITLLFLTVL